LASVRDAHANGVDTYRNVVTHTSVSAVNADR
jgi:hypothetical protein